MRLIGSVAVNADTTSELGILSKRPLSWSNQNALRGSIKYFFSQKKVHPLTLLLVAECWTNQFLINRMEMAARLHGSNGMFLDMHLKLRE
ncbi:hypothetical protein CPELA_09275 [Corynebacterium pelargi]|uniref:Uncharacterized protein n=1 Tax=Corynebacterium pelargi TaxID=1471400 RepID=A0A410WAZ9_9CORY|nr:hypothetical protein CPELA_09275 [Corynebacterium pelargi]